MVGPCTLKSVQRRVLYVLGHYSSLSSQTQVILNSRVQEEINTSLTISVYDVARNETARTHRRELELRIAEEERIRKEKEMDYLAPFAARIGDPPTFDRKQIEEVSQVSDHSSCKQYT